MPSPFSAKNPGDSRRCNEALHEFARRYPFEPEKERYLVHIDGHARRADPPLLLTETGFFPGSLLQSEPPRKGGRATYSLIDPSIARYDRIARRFEAERTERPYTKAGIETANRDYNSSSIASSASRAPRAPILLSGPTGKSARRARATGSTRFQRGLPIEVNCATLRGDQAMSAPSVIARAAVHYGRGRRPRRLSRGGRRRPFLDEIGELGLDESRRCC